MALDPIHVPSDLPLVNCKKSPRVDCKPRRALLQRTNQHGTAHRGWVKLHASLHAVMANKVRRKVTRRKTLEKN